MAQADKAPAPHAPGIIGQVAGTGAFPAIAEARADAPGYTLYHPEKLPGDPLPLVLWGNGGCRDNGLSASHFLREVASHGYIVIANGAARRETPVRAAGTIEPPPAGPPPAPTADETSVAQLLAAIDWASTANGAAGDGLNGHIDLTRIAVMGHSCGGLQALAAGGDPRISAVVAFASGIYNQPRGGISGVRISKNDLKRLHTPVAYVLGGPTDIAYPNGMDDFARIDHVPALAANLDVGHGGTFSHAHGGEWARFAALWLDWQLKNSTTAAQWFTGANCLFCTDNSWTIQRKNFSENP